MKILKGRRASDLEAARSLSALRKPLAPPSFARPEDVADVVALAARGAAPRRLDEARAVTVTPPFDYAYDFALPPRGPARVASFSSAVTGRIAVALETIAAKPGTALGRAEVGVYFRPAFGRPPGRPARLRVRTSPTLAFSWWANSITAAPPAVTRAVATLAVSRRSAPFSGPPERAVKHDLIAWDVAASEDLQFDIGAQAESPASLDLPVSLEDLGDPCDLYVVSLSCECHVEGAGWPGSLAGANLSMTVQSISFELVADPGGRPASGR